MSGDDSETFKKRAGCTDRGRDYEHLYIANLILKLLADNTVQNFKISSNDDNFGVFDDVVVDIENTDATKETYAIQLKHVNKGKALTKNGLAEKRGNFSIRKYFEDFAKLAPSDPIKFVLFTNLKFEVRDNEQITLADDDFSISTKIGQQDFRLGTGTGRCYQFVSPNKKYEDFFKDFVLYTNQESVNTLKTDTMTKFRTLFDCDDGIFDQYVQFVTQWSLSEGKKDKLSKKLVISAIVMRILTPHMLPLQFSSDPISDNTKLFRETMSIFQVTCFHPSQSDKAQRIWRDAKLKLDTKNLNEINTKFQVTPSYISQISDLSDKDCSKFLWLMGLCPLLVAASHTFEKVRSLCNNHQFVVFGTTNSEKVFRDLTNLDPHSYNKIVTLFKCSVQGKSDLSLECFIGGNPKIRDIVTTDELIQMLDDSFKIGGKEEILPIPHIDRMLTRNIVSVKCLDAIDTKNTLVLVRNVTPSDLNTILRPYIDKIMFISKPDPTNKQDKFSHSVNECSEAHFKDLCGKSNKVRSHQFRMLDEQLEWVQSTGGVNELKEFQLQGAHIEQSALFEQPCDNKINIVCADPGMGKSILMKNLKNSSTMWSVLIEPKDHAKYFRDQNSNIKDFINYGMTKMCKNCDKFVSQYLEILVEDCQVMFIWDGLDEVAPDNLIVVLEIIEKLSARGFTQWLTSRCNLIKTLEHRFKVLSRTIEQFDTEQQNVYIEKRLSCTQSDLPDIKKKIHKCIKLVQSNDILGIPLQIYMFTELFRQNPDKYRTLLSNIFSITDLYRHFVDEKFNIYHQVKANLDDSNDVMMQIVERSKKERLQQYEEAALKTYLPDVLKELTINCDKFLEGIQASCDGVGIIVDVTDEKVPSFLHNSYGEYFAASFLSKNHEKVQNLIDFIFEERYNNIRFLFDLLMAENRPAHIATLYKNLKVLVEFEANLTHKDKGGRNPLHLACSWGKRFSLKRSHENQTKEESSEHQKILTFLCEKCDPFELDGLFQMDSFNYADRSFSLHPILLLSNKRKFDFALLKNFTDINTILYNAVKFDYADVFEDIPFVTIDEKQSLLHLSVTKGSINCLKKILTNPEYLNSVECRDRNGLTPFLLACRSVHLEIIETLVAAGADTSAASPSGYSAIYMAAQAGHPHVIQLLLDSGLDINARNELGETSLLLASKSKSCEMVQMLINFGADVGLGDNFGYTPLYMACRYQAKQVVKLLLENNADVTLANIHGDLPLFMAAWKGDLDVVELLLDAGADIDGVNKRGHGAIHAACINRYIEVLEFLVETHADVNVPNKYGQTPLHLAVRHYFKEGIVLLLKAGADVRVVNKHGETFWDMGIRYYDETQIADFVVTAKGQEFLNEFKERFRSSEVSSVVTSTPKNCNVM